MNDRPQIMHYDGDQLMRSHDAGKRCELCLPVVTITVNPPVAVDAVPDFDKWWRVENRSFGPWGTMKTAWDAALAACASGPFNAGPSGPLVAHPKRYTEADVDVAAKAFDAYAGPEDEGHTHCAIRVALRALEEAQHGS